MSEQFKNINAVEKNRGNDGTYLFIHSECCTAHFETVLFTDKKTLEWFCEKCGEHSGIVINLKKLKKSKVAGLLEMV